MYRIKDDNVSINGNYANTSRMVVEKTFIIAKRSCTNKTTHLTPAA